MAFSPAAVVSIFVRSASDEERRLAALQRTIDSSIDLGGEAIVQTIAEVQAGRTPSERHLGIHRHRRGLPIVEGWLTINRDDRTHENVCLPADRSMLLRLLEGGSVDVVDFAKGVPRSKAGIFGQKYEPGSVCGRRPFVALWLLVSSSKPVPAEIAASLQQLVSGRWEDLAADVETVELVRDDWGRFLASCASLPYFSSLASELRAAAGRS